MSPEVMPIIPPAEETVPVPRPEKKVAPELVTAETMEGMLGKKMGRQLFEFVRGLGTTRELVREHEQRILKDSLEFHLERNRRAEDAEKLRESEAPKIAHELFIDDPAAIMCMDGRMGTVRTFLMGAGIGSAMKSAGGFVPECVPGEKGLILNENTQFARELKNISERRKNFMEVMVSHTGCAAAGLKEGFRGTKPADGGLLNDIRKKKEVGKALGRFLEKHANPEVFFLPVQFIFNMENGYGYMGAETDQAQAKLNKGESLTIEVMDRLAEEGFLVSTKSMAREFQELFKKYEFKPDWQKKYADHLEQAWKNIQSLVQEDAILQKIAPMVLRVYPELGADDPRSTEELHKRSVLALLNAYAGYINNIGGYENSIHRERSVRIGDREFGPFDYEILGVSGSNLEALISEIKTAVGVVRESRDKKRILINGAPTEIPTEAPVTVLAEKVVRGLNKEDWEVLEKVDFSDLPKDWRTNVMSDDEFNNYLTDKLAMLRTGSYRKVFEALNRLRAKMSIIYDPHRELSEYVMDGSVIAIPTLSDRNREAHIVFPFRMDYFVEESV